MVILLLLATALAGLDPELELRFQALVGDLDHLQARIDDLNQQINDELVRCEQLKAVAGLGAEADDQLAEKGLLHDVQLATTRVARSREAVARATPEELEQARLDLDDALRQLSVVDEAASVLEEHGSLSRAAAHRLVDGCQQAREALIHERDRLQETHSILRRGRLRQEARDVQDAYARSLAGRDGLTIEEWRLANLRIGWAMKLSGGDGTAAFSAYVAAGGTVDGIPDEIAADVNAAAAALHEALPAHLTLRLPWGSRAHLDGHEVPLLGGQTTVEVLPGTHRLTAERGGEFEVHWIEAAPAERIVLDTTPPPPRSDASESAQSSTSSSEAAPPPPWTLTMGTAAGLGHGSAAAGPRLGIGYQGASLYVAASLSALRSREPLWIAPGVEATLYGRVEVTAARWWQRGRLEPAVGIGLWGEPMLGTGALLCGGLTLQTGTVSPALGVQAGLDVLPHRDGVPRGWVGGTLGAVIRR